MHDKSLYEGGHPQRFEQNFGVAFGRITKVYVEERLCEVKTFQGYGSFDDQHIPKCQWLCMDANPEGDEQTIIPRENSTGLVLWVNGEPFIIGYFKALQKKSQGGGAITGNEPSKLNSGDKVLSTVAGNRLVVKSSGLIEVHSKDTLRRLYFPTDSRLIDICANYIMQADGGMISWENQNILNQTLYRHEYRKDITRSVILVDEIGNVDATTMKRTRVGPGIPGAKDVALPTYEHTIAATGEFTVAVLPQLPAFKANVKPTGETTINIGLTNSMSVSPLGDYNFKNAIGEFSLSAGGDLEIKNAAFSMKASAIGEVIIEGATAKVALSNGQVAIGGPAGELLDLMDQFLDLVDKLLQDITAITVPTSVGPSGPPINSAAFISHKVTLALIKTTLGLIKRSL